MNKNLKKMFILCIYNITLSANIALCCETNLNLILNDHDEEPSLTTINEMFGYITHQNFNNQQNTKFEQVENNPETKKRKITLTDLLNPEIKPDKIQKTENETDYNFQEKGIKSFKEIRNYTKIEFSSVDTEEKYSFKAATFPQGKGTLTLISCPFCNSTAKGLFGRARKNMSNHIEQQHGKKQTSKTKNEIKFNIEFSSIDTQEKYDNWALKYANKQTYVNITCSKCFVTRKGPLSNARVRMLTHIKEKHPNL